jgi:ABC-2 type transport system ATP-binding protein
LNESPPSISPPASTSPSGAAAPALLELRGLAKRYGAVTALHDVTARVSGRIVGLLGPNGAGKSTLLKCLLGLIPFEGHAAVLGLPAGTEGAAIRDRVGYMPESEAMLMGMSAVELCTYAAQLSGLPRTEAMQRAHAALYFAGLEDKRYQPIESYSTGMKQRVKLAQALVHDPELLFLDEPTNGLDPRAREEMLALIRELPERRGCAIILSTHLLPDVERVCDQAVIMHNGTMRFSGSIEELRRNRSEEDEYIVEVKEHAERLVAELRAAGATSEVTSPLTASLILPDGAKTRLAFEAARRAGSQIRRIEIRRDSLETAFLRVIGEAAAAPPPSAPYAPPRGDS